MAFGAKELLESLKRTVSNNSGDTEILKGIREVICDLIEPPSKVNSENIPAFTKLIEEINKNISGP